MSAHDTPLAAVARVGVLPVLAAAEFMLTLDLSIVNVALPSIRGDLGFGLGGLEWVVNGYALTFGGLLLLGGRAADLFGGRRVFLAALSVFGLASLACGLAAGPVALVAARVVQGASAGVLSPTTLSLLTGTYDAPDQRNRALSIWTAVAIGGGAVGALLGGALIEALSWRWIFLVNVPVGALLLVLAPSRLPRRAADTARRELDAAGTVTVTGGLVAFVWALIHAQDAGWGSRQVMGGLILAAVLLSAFAMVEARVAGAPLVPFSAFRSRPLAAGNALSFLSFVPVPPTWFLLTLYLQDVRGYTPLQTGLFFVPISLAVVGGSQVGFRAMSRLSPRLLLFAGGAVAAAGMLSLSQLSATGGLLWTVIVPAAITMAGGGLVFAPTTVAATSGLGPDQSGLAGGLLNTSRQIGGALGLAVLATVAAGGHRGGAVTGGSASAFAVGAAVFAVTAIVGALALPARLGPPNAADDAPEISRTESRAARPSRRDGAPTGRSRLAIETDHSPIGNRYRERRAGRV